MTTSALSTLHWFAAASPGTSDRREVDNLLEALHPRVMGPRISAALSSGPQPCHVVDAKYERGVGAIVLYQHGTRWVRGDVHDAEAAPTSPRLVVSPGVQLSVFPYDPDLPSLVRVVDSDDVGPLIADRMTDLSAESRRALARRCTVRPVRYRPGKRVTVELSAPLQPTDYVAKVYHDPAKAASVAGEARVLGVMPSTGGLRFAPVVAHVPELALVAHRAVRGTNVDALLGGRGGPSLQAPGAVERCARALAELHRFPRVSDRPRPVESELHRFALRAGRVATVDTDLGHLLLGLAERLRDTHARLSPPPLGTVHGDCKPSQFLLAREGVYLLDMDHCGVGDQAGDVGTFLASLRQGALRAAMAGTRIQHQRLEAVAQTFVDAYMDGRLDPGLLVRIRWQEAVALERKALRAFARAPLSPLPRLLVHAGDDCLDNGHGDWT